MSGENRTPEEENSQPPFVDDRTPSEVEYDQQMDRLDTLFSSLDPGVSLLVQRIQPSWCKGVLEELTIGDDEVNLDYFIENWGGQLLLVKIRGDRGRVKGNYRIPLYSYPPMVYGKRLKYNDKSERFTDDPEPQAPNTAQSSPIVVNQPSSMEKVFQLLPTIIPMFAEMMKAQEARRQADLAMMLQISKSQGGGLSDITKVGAVMGQLSEMFRNNNAEISNPGDADFMGNALEVIKTVFANKQDVPVQDSHKLIPPKSSRPITGPPVPSSNSVVTPITKSAPQNPPDAQNTNIAQSISMMDAKEAADTIIEAMCRMPSSKRDDAIGNFIAQYKDDMGIDNEVEDGDDDYVDSEESRGRRR